MSRKMTINDYDERIKKLQEKRKAAVIAEKKRIANEAKNNEIKRNAIVFEAIQGFLQHKGLGDADILSLGAIGLRDVIFDKPKPPAGAQ